MTNPFFSPFVNVLFDAETPEEIQGRFFDHINVYFPEWEPREGSLEYVQAEMIAQLWYELMTLASDVPPTIMQNLGTLIRIPPFPAATATVQLRYTASDNLGHTLPSDTLVAWDAGNDTGVGFYTTSEAVIPPGSTFVDVTAYCEVEGFVGNGFAGSPQLITLIDWVETVVALAPTDGGQDQESISDYLNRFSQRLQLLKDRPIREHEVAIWATTVLPFVGRAIAFDNYNAATMTPDQERHCTLVTHALDGEDNTEDEVTELMAALALTREIGFVFHHRHPDRIGVGVQVAVVPEAGWDPAAIEANVIASLTSALDPLIWGLPTSAQGPEWQNTTILRYGWVYSQVARVTGVRYVATNTLQIRVSTMDPIDWVEDDVALEGLAPLTYADLENIFVFVLPEEV